jgi:2-polyprenyl-3-methyl-5-hydroxy-6-metoxy-1,4-benzoquinol methylase
MTEEKSSESRCWLCGYAKFEPVRFGLLNCAGCGLVVSPIIWKPKSNEKMEEEWFGEGYCQQSSVWVRLFEAWNNSRTLGRLIMAKPPGCRLLEIGVGSGTFLEAVRKRGFEVTGCDLSRAICDGVGGKYGVAMHCGSLAELKGDSRFDAVVMNHVLEHVNDPIAFLRDALRLLTPGGVLHVAVPNVACWEARLSGWTSYEPYHLSYFTPKTLRKVLAASGFSVERVETHESFSGWFLAILRTLLGVRRERHAILINIRSRSIATHRSRPVLVEHAYRLAMVCTGGVMYPLRVLQAMLGRGDEATCIARKLLAGSAK